MSVPISLELAKAHLRIGDDTSLDALIEQYMEMAFAIAEDYTNRKLTEGYSEGNLPASIRAAILLILGTLFDNEADVVVGRSVAQLPLTAERLLQPWRIHPYSANNDV
uniref:head-tail connector protein n=1 Tax=Alistipes sp. TaxID=1872444 RepID=UPI004056C0CC